MQLSVWPGSVHYQRNHYSRNMAESMGQASLIVRCRRLQNSIVQACSSASIIGSLNGHRVYIYRMNLWGLL